MRNVYSSAALLSDKQHGWQQYVSEIFVPVELDIDQRGGREFVGEIRRASLSSLDITRMATDRESAFHDRRHIAGHARAFFLFVVVRSGALEISQFGRDCRVPAAHFTLIDSGAPFRYAHDERIHGLSLKIPSELLEARFADPRRFCAVTRVVELGLGRMVVGLLDALVDDAAHMDPTAAAVAENGLLDLLTLLFESEAGEHPNSSSVRWAIHRRCVAFLRTHFADPGLSPSSLADAMGISVRYAHKVFQETGQTIGECLLDLRLDRCHEALAKPEMAQFSIKQLAIRNGFSNSSHFSTAFKAKYGVSPMQKRRALVLR